MTSGAVDIFFVPVVEVVAIVCFGEPACHVAVAAVAVAVVGVVVVAVLRCRNL